LRRKDKCKKEKIVTRRKYIGDSQNNAIWLKIQGFGLKRVVGRLLVSRQPKEAWRDTFENWGKQQHLVRLWLLPASIGAGPALAEMWGWNPPISCYLRSAALIQRRTKTMQWANNADNCASSEESLHASHDLANAFSGAARSGMGVRSLWRSSYLPITLGWRNRAICLTIQGFFPLCKLWLCFMGSDRPDFMQLSMQGTSLVITFDSIVLQNRCRSRCP